MAHYLSPRELADGFVKTAIFGRLYNVSIKSARGPITGDRVATISREYRENGGLRSNTRYGYVHQTSV